jgi:trigger factor
MTIEATFPAVIAENNLEPLGYPEVQVLKLAQGNPFEYRATVAVYPRVELPDYKEILQKFELKEIKVTEDDIKRLKMEKERHEREHVRQDALAAVAAETAVEVPGILITRETEKMMNQLKERTPQMLNMSFDDYLKKLGKTEAELEDAMAKDNEIKIKNYLVLTEIARAENIEVTDEEAVAAAKKEINGEAVPNEQDKNYWREALKNEKTFEKLENYFKK